MPPHSSLRGTLPPIRLRHLTIYQGRGYGENGRIIRKVGGQIPNHEDIPSDKMLAPKGAQTIVRKGKIDKILVVEVRSVRFAVETLEEPQVVLDPVALWKNSHKEVGHFEVVRTRSSQ